MFSALKGYFLNTTKVTGVEYRVLADGAISINSTNLIIEKKSISISSTSDNVNFDEFIKENDSSIPLALSICGKGVLTKTLTNLNQKVQDVLPNINLEEFYIQKEDNILCLARKEVIDEIISSFKENNFDVISVNFSGLSLKSILSFIDEKELHLSTFGYKIENGLMGSSFKDVIYQKYKVGNEYVTSLGLISFSTAFQELLPNYHTHSLKDEKIEAYKEEHKQKKIFTLIGFTSLVFIFVVLLANFFIFNNLRERFNDKSSELSIYNSQLSKLKSVKEEVKKKEKFMKQSGWYNPSKVSFYADRIGKTIPKSITLTLLDVNPFDKNKSKKTKELKFENKLIKLEGLTQTSFEMNKWINSLKELDWVEDAQVSSYISTPRKKQANFIIEVLIK